MNQRAVPLPKSPLSMRLRPRGPTRLDVVDDPRAGPAPRRRKQKREARRVPGPAVQVAAVERHARAVATRLTADRDLGCRNRARAVVEQVLLADLDVQSRGDRRAGVEASAYTDPA